MQKVIFFLVMAISALAKEYCRPRLKWNCWPKKWEWEALNKTLHGKLFKIDIEMYDECLAQKTDSYKLLTAAHGICMQFHNCARKSCVLGSAWNLPAYTVAAEEVQDVQVALKFAEKHDIEVSVKNTGHSHSGTSTGNQTLMIWVHNLKKQLIPSPQGHSNGFGPFNDSCDTVYPHTIKVGGGQNWGEVYAFLAVTQQYYLAGAPYPTVSVAGGWLQGVGLSPLSRYAGTGVQTVLSMEVVLANGSFVTTDKCTHPDLFWALRGGGGGTFGIVTSATFKLQPSEIVTRVELIVAGSKFASDIHHSFVYEQFIRKLVEWTPNLDKRWTGYWSLRSLDLYFFGSKSEAVKSFVSKVYEWKASLPVENQHIVVVNLVETKNVYHAFGFVQNFGKIFKGFTGLSVYYHGNRLIPRRMVVEQNETVVDLLTYLYNHGTETAGYLLGGVMEENNRDTSVNPAMWKALFQLELYDKNMLQYAREVIKDSGAGYNHAAPDEPDWQNQFWGPNYKRLLEIKKKYDPEQRFNCHQCVGNEDEITSSATFTATFLMLFCCLQLFVFIVFI